MTRRDKSLGNQGDAATEEEIYNLVAFIEDGLLKRVGIVAHIVAGSDAEKTAYLQARVEADHCRAFTGRLIEPIPADRYQAMVRLGTALELFGQLLDHVNAPAEPVMCLTSIVDGRPVVHASVEGYGLVDLSKLPDGLLEPGKMEDYLVKYMTDGSFDMPRLINDDYFLAIKLLFNNWCYVSCIKLLMSFLDTVAFVEMGDVNGNFIPWLNGYADLGTVGVTGEELWELRNGLLHMSNLDSKKVLKGSHARLTPYVGTHDLPLSSDPESKPFNLVRLLEAVTKALEAWMRTYVETPIKMRDFVLRYDRIISDSRVAAIMFETG